jgi:hypothetical protein
MFVSTPSSSGPSTTYPDEDLFHNLRVTRSGDLLRRAVARCAGLLPRGTGARLRAEFPGVSGAVITEAIWQARVLCAAFGFDSSDAVRGLARARLSGRGRHAGIAPGEPRQPEFVLVACSTSSPGPGGQPPTPGKQPTRKNEPHHARRVLRVSRVFLTGAAKSRGAAGRTGPVPATRAPVT